MNWWAQQKTTSENLSDKSKSKLFSEFNAEESLNQHQAKINKSQFGRIFKTKLRADDIQPNNEKIADESKSLLKSQRSPTSPSLNVPLFAVKMHYSKF